MMNTALVPASYTITVACSVYLLWTHGHVFEDLVFRPCRILEVSWDSCLITTLIQMLPVEHRNVVSGVL